jgi:hypothetical protein
MRRILPIAFISIVGGILAHLSVFLFVHIEVPTIPAEPVDMVSVQYVGDLGIRANPALREQALLLDSAPLFMPTRSNLVSQMDDVASLREATEVFSPYPPSLTLPESSPGSFPIVSNDGLFSNAFLPGGPTFFLSRFGREPAEPLSGLASEPSVQPQRLGGMVNRTLRSTALPDALRRRSPKTLWAPLNIYLHLVNGMPLGQAVIAESSGFSDWDQAVQDFVGSLDYYRSLKSGYYRITVYP